LSHTITGHVVALAALALTGPFLLPRIVAAQEWLAPAHDLPNVARWVFTVLALGLLAAAAAALGKRRAWVPVTIAATFVAAVPLVIQGMQLFARVNSSAGMAAALRAYAQPGEQVVYEAPVEYQNCAGFNFYLRRRVDLLRPAGFVPPRYLEPYVDELFISPERLASMWEQARTFLVTNPLQPRARLDGTVPHPFYVVARDTVRWALTSRPVH
jgi:hypothetical protein